VKNKETTFFKSTETAKIEVLNSPEEVQNIKDSLDSPKNNLDENYILIPTKLPFKAFILLVVHTVILIVSGTIFYTNVINKLEDHGRKLERLENNVYSKDQVESRIKFEVQSSEHRLLNSRYEEAVREIQGRKNNEISR
jgi:hypothetical protein